LLLLTPQVSANGTSVIYAASTPAPLSAAGGTVSFRLDAGTPFSAVANAFLLPAFSLDFSASVPPAAAVAAAFAARKQLRGLSCADGQNCSGSSPALRPGSYLLMVQGSSGWVVLSSQVLTVALSISSISPSNGSIGGSTLLTIQVGAALRMLQPHSMLCPSLQPRRNTPAPHPPPPPAPQGSGFAALPGIGNASSPSSSASGLSPLVYIPVPRSSTFPSMAVECDVVSANDTAIACITRAHLAADASASDPFAVQVAPRPSPAAVVRVALCEPGLSGIDRIVCAYDQGTPVASCSASDPAACSFSYSWEATPNVVGTYPPVGRQGDSLVVVGTNLGSVVQVRGRVMGKQQLLLWMRVAPVLIPTALPCCYATVCNPRLQINFLSAAGQPPVGSCNTSTAQVPGNLTALNITSTSGPSGPSSPIGNATLQAVSCTVPALQGGAYLLQASRWSCERAPLPLLAREHLLRIATLQGHAGCCNRAKPCVPQVVRGSGERGTGMSGATFVHMGSISDIGNWWGPTTGGEPLVLNVSGALLNTAKPSANQVRGADLGPPSLVACCAVTCIIHPTVSPPAEPTHKPPAAGDAGRHPAMPGRPGVGGAAVLHAAPSAGRGSG
jgi:hypothetical protein